jgi:hypothetical protein
MRFVFILVGLIVICCSQRSVKPAIENDQLYGDIKDGIPDVDTLMALLGVRGDTVEHGRFAMTGRHISSLRVGPWKEYHANGKVKSEGQYKIGSFLDCCAGGLCRQFYYYRIGIWKYFDLNGTLACALEFKPKKLRVESRCGGDALVFGLVETIPAKYAGNVSTDRLYELQKISFRDRDYDGWTTYTPLNGHLFIDYIPDN